MRCSEIEKLFNKIKIIKPFGESKIVKAMSFVICSSNDENSLQLSRKFNGIDQVQIVQGDIFNVNCSAIVSPANSFGEMSGGLDKAIDDHYKGKAQTEAVKVIREKYLGELPVGCGLVLEMEVNNKFPYLILAPTMRIPGNESNSINAYLAMRGLLVSIAQYNRLSESKIDSVVIPSFCTGVGGMLAAESAEQMYSAFDNVVMSGWEYVKHPAMAPYAAR
jgi:O-acetyl-ADP-ribose deacetylase (regulator of RNase III)